MSVERMTGVSAVLTECKSIYFGGNLFINWKLIINWEDMKFIITNHTKLTIIRLRNFMHLMQERRQCVQYANVSL